MEGQLPAVITLNWSVLRI